MIKLSILRIIFRLTVFSVIGGPADLQRFAEFVDLLQRGVALMGLGEGAEDAAFEIRQHLLQRA